VLRSPSLGAVMAGSRKMGGARGARWKLSERRCKRRMRRGGIALVSLSLKRRKVEHRMWLRRLGGIREIRRE
jgi:hypothetical protein